MSQLPTSSGHLVPAGLDFCNHASPSPCYWTVFAAAAALGKGSSSSSSSGAQGGNIDAISLVCPRRAVPPAGGEITIDYGGKSNEELMFQYGFAIQDNPAEVRWLPRLAAQCAAKGWRDPGWPTPTAGSHAGRASSYQCWRGTQRTAAVGIYACGCGSTNTRHVRARPLQVLTVMCPLPPPGEWDDLLRARLALLSVRGLRPQLHLPAADLARLGASETDKDAVAAKRSGGRAGAGAASGGAGGRDDGVLASDLPEHVLETLEVFVMPAAQVAAELEAADAAGSSDGGSGNRLQQRQQIQQARQQQQREEEEEEERSGRRMALLTTLVRLLELKALEMEGQEGERLPGDVRFLLASQSRAHTT